MNEEKIKRINELTAISRKRALTEEEQKERASLRRDYIDSMKRSLTNQLDNTYILMPDGTKKKVAPKN